MIASFLLLLASAPVASPGSASASDAMVLALAEHSFAEGVSLRGDSVKARPAFARSAIAYDELWRRGCRQPEAALNRAHAHQLAGELPQAIAALHEGLDETPWSRLLQVALANARSSIAYPLTGDLAAECRPNAVVSIGSRMSRIEVVVLASAIWLIVCLGLARYAMKRTLLWLGVSGLAMVLLSILGGLWLDDICQRHRENAEPLVIVAADAILRKGNGETYPPRLEPRLPRGVEARELYRRGGWVQVRLSGGAIGWLPETAVIGVER